MREVFGVRENRTSRRSAEQNRRRVPSTPRLALSLFAVSIPAWCVSGCVCLPPHLPATMPPHPLPQSLSFSAPTLSLAPFLSLRTHPQPPPPLPHAPSPFSPGPIRPLFQIRSEALAPYQEADRLAPSLRVSALLLYSSLKARPLSERRPRRKNSPLPTAAVPPTFVFPCPRFPFWNSCRVKTQTPIRHHRCQPFFRLLPSPASAAQLLARKPFGRSGRAPRQELTEHPDWGTLNQVPFKCSPCAKPSKLLSGPRSLRGQRLSVWEAALARLVG